MLPAVDGNIDSLWEGHAMEFRDPAEALFSIPAFKHDACTLLRHETEGDFAGLLHQLKITLLVTREYEHLLLAIGSDGKRLKISYLPVPHPSGMAWDSRSSRLYVALTRNPNQIIQFSLVNELLNRGDISEPVSPGGLLTPTASRILPGSLYIHDLAFVGKKLYASAVGHNSIVELPDTGGFKRAWWPKCIETADGPEFGLNYLQLNSISGGATLSSCFFSASASRIGKRRPGHKNFPVEGRGVIFSGKTREPVTDGLTRPHSARTYRGKLYVNNSGMGTLCVVDGNRLQVACALPGWTRGLCFRNRYAITGTSRVIPRFSQYAPGLDVVNSRCGVHLVNLKTGEREAAIFWPSGNQIFTIEALPSRLVAGLPYYYPHQNSRRVREFFYAFTTNTRK